MRVLLVGKLGALNEWAEGCIVGLRQAGHTVRVVPTRRGYLAPVLNRLLMSQPFGTPLSVAVPRAIESFRPDLVLYVSAYNNIPPEALLSAAAMPNRPPLVGWVGDVFGEAERQFGEALDLVAYTDTAMLAVHRQLRFRSRAIYLPHAADPRLQHTGAARRQGIAFVGAPSVGRRATLAQLSTPVAVYGADWGRAGLPSHRIRAVRVRAGRLGRIYRASAAILNIPNEKNVVQGLNQRNFDPYMTGTPVIAARQADLADCFEIGREVFAYDSQEELNAVCREVLSRPELAAGIGGAGRARVERDHLYGSRLASARDAL